MSREGRRGRGFLARPDCMGIMARKRGWIIGTASSVTAVVGLSFSCHEDYNHGCGDCITADSPPPFPGPNHRCQPVGLSSEGSCGVQ
jgi:hypothetical protein